MTNHITRRSILAAAPALVATPLTAGAPRVDHATKVEAVMASVVPHTYSKYQVVEADALKALCDAVGVEWRSHWALATVAVKARKDLHPEWFAQWKELSDHVNNSGDDYDEHSDELHRLEMLICETQPKTRDGAAAQLEYALDDFGEYMLGNIWHDLDRKLFANLLAGIRGGLT